MGFQRAFFIEKARQAVFGKRLFYRRGVGFQIGHEHGEIAVTERGIFGKALFDFRRYTLHFVVFIFRFENADGVGEVRFFRARKRRGIEQTFAKHFRRAAEGRAEIDFLHGTAGGFFRRAQKGAERRARIDILFAVTEYARYVIRRRERRFQRFCRLRRERAVTEKVYVRARKFARAF